MIVFFYTLLEKKDIKKIDLVDFPDSKVAATGAMPGLYVIPNFISEQEETDLMTSLDAGKWVKMLKRRV
jgi:hypothetical protein